MELMVVVARVRRALFKGTHQGSSIRVAMDLPQGSAPRRGTQVGCKGVGYFRDGFGGTLADVALPLRNRGMEFEADLYGARVATNLIGP